MTRRILDVERLPTEPNAVHRTRRADPVSIILQAGLLAAGDLAPAGPHHLGGRPPYVGDTLLSAIPEWCARQVHDLVPDADRQEFEAILECAREYREHENASVPLNGAQPRRLNALAVAGFSGAVAIRLQRRGHALDRLVARCVAFTVELLKRRTEGERVHRFLLDLDRELVIAHTRMLMRRCKAFEHESRLVDVVGRGGAIERYVFCGEWAVVRLQSGAGTATEAFCHERPDGEGTWIETPLGELRRRLPGLMKSNPWDGPRMGRRFADRVARTQDLQDLSSAILSSMPERGEVLVGMIRLICGGDPGTHCRNCTGRWHRTSEGSDCAYCAAVLERARRTLALPTLGMVVSEAKRALDARGHPDRERQLASLIRWARAAGNRRGCPMCRRNEDPRVATAQGSICETCLHFPVVAEWRRGEENSLSEY